MLTKILFHLSTQKPSLSKLLIKTPKLVENDLQTGFLSMLFDQSKKSPTYILLKQMFVYLQQSRLLNEEFPFIKSDTRFEQNWMVVHLHLLKSRIREEKHRSDSINQLDLEKFNYNAQTYFFAPYAKYLYPQTPTRNYASHYAQSFHKRFLVIEEAFNENYEPKPSQAALLLILRRFLYENRVSEKDNQLAKLSKYYVAHRRYLSMLQWGDLVSFKVKWGFENQRFLLQTLSQ